MKKLTALTLTALVGVLFLSSPAKAATFLAWDFDGRIGNEVTVNSDVNDPAFTVSQISRGDGITAAANADRFNATSWTFPETDPFTDAVTENSFMQFTLTPVSGSTIYTIESIAFNIERSPTGLRNVQWRSSLDAFGAGITGGTFPIADITTSQPFILNLVGNPTFANLTGPVTFRMYGIAEADAGSGGFEGTGNDLVVTGTVVPEPSTYALVGLSMLGLALAARRRGAAVAA